jgi:L-lysine exporter family protein LysE/ArgO
VLAAFFQGFMLGAGLIVAIGSQNAYVLRQGLKREQVLLVCMLCALSDALLIAVGVSGTGTLVASSETLLLFVRIAGALFLTVYGVKAAVAALKGEYLDTARGGDSQTPVRTIVLTTLAFTYLNPHVYLDTVVLLGSIAGQFEWAARIEFGAGAVLASFVWFFMLGFGARWLAPLFQKPQAWKLLDLLIALIMFSLAISLLYPLFG